MRKSYWLSRIYVHNSLCAGYLLLFKCTLTRRCFGCKPNVVRQVISIDLTFSSDDGQKLLKYAPGDTFAMACPNNADEVHMGVMRFAPQVVLPLFLTVRCPF